MTVLSVLLAALCALLVSHTSNAAISPRARRISATPPTTRPTTSLPTSTSTITTTTHLPTYPPLNHLADNLRQIPYPHPPLPHTVYLYSQDNYSPADFFLLLTLQGALAKLNAERAPSSKATKDDVLLFHVTGNATQPTSPEWIYWTEFQSLLGNRVTFNNKHIGNTVSDWLILLGHRITGYYLTEMHTDSVNIGVSLAGITTGAIAATESHVKLLSKLNIPLLEDVRNTTEQQFIARYISDTTSSVLPVDWPFSTRFIACEIVDKSITSLTDWVILLGSITIHRTDTYQLLLPLLHTAHNPPQFNVVFGWVTDNSTEHDFTGNASEWGAGVLASDWLNNGATHASLQLPSGVSLVNPTKANPTMLPYNKGKHTVAVVFTDGDNICSDLNLLLDKTHWNHPRRGEIAIGWGINPTLAYTAPIGLHTYYSQSNSSKDSFVAFSSTYAFPEAMPAGGSVEEWAEATGAAMATADIRVVNFIGNDWNATHWSALLQQHNIDGAIYFMYYGNYVLDPPDNGSVQWVNNKPGIAVRAALWQDHSTPKSIAQMLNNQSRDETTVDGYSVIAVHIWSETVDSLLEMNAAFDDDVILVKPDELVALMTAKVVR